MYEKVLVGSDLSDTAAIAVERAASVAERVGASLVLVYAGADPGDPLKELADRHGAEPVAVSGNPAEVLVAEAAERDALLVVGNVGMSGARRFMLGNVPNKVSHTATTDLLIVKTDKGAEAKPYSKILVGTDGSPTAMRAVDAAAQLSKALGITPTIVCAYQPPTEAELKSLRADPNDVISQWSAGEAQRGTPEEFRWRIAGASQAEDVLERAEDHAGNVGVSADVRAVEGAPADTLLDIAEDEGFDLIVVGSVGMTGARRFMLGNVPHRISHHAPTDVLILRTA